MTKTIISLIAVIMMASLTAYAADIQAQKGFTVTTIALDAEEVLALEAQMTEDDNTSTKGEPIEK